MNWNDPIAALATPPGESGLAVVRLSGPGALAVADRCFRPRGRRSVRPSEAPTHTVHYGHILREGRPVDEVLLTVLKAPHSYTGEDTVEISCHGGGLPARLTLEALLAAGARPAEPGEFTRRAFLNGRLDLAQAEAVADVIHARTELALAAAQRQLAGGLSRRVRQVREQLLATLAHVEAQLDFPEEDLAPDTAAQLRARLETALADMDALLRTAREGRLLRQGLRVTLIGRANAGKSSLLNRLLDHDRAIVAPTPGTTRDTITETANLRGLPVTLTDTAGLRAAGDAIEREGVRRGEAAQAEADLLLHVLDAAEPLAPEDRERLAAPAAKPRILVRNKSDLPARLELPPELSLPVVETSCVTGAGIETLKDAIKDAAWRGEIRTDQAEVMINARHQDALQRARAAARLAGDALEKGVPLDLVAPDLHAAVNAVGEITGQTTTEDLLDAIFSQFCIGK